jgi:hypothetical protein
MEPLNGTRPERSEAGMTPPFAWPLNAFLSGFLLMLLFRLFIVP